MVSIMESIKPKRSVKDPLYRGKIHEPLEKCTKRMNYSRQDVIEDRQTNATMLHLFNAKPFDMIMKYALDVLMPYTKIIKRLKYNKRRERLYITLSKGKVKITPGRKIVPVEGKANRTLPCYDVYLSNILKTQETSQAAVIDWMNKEIEKIYK